MTKENTILASDGVGLSDPDKIFQEGMEYIRKNNAEQALAIAQRAVCRHEGDARLWQLLGLAARSLDQSALAVEAFANAARLAPFDPLIAHSHARVTLEAGLPASALFDRARKLAPQDGSVLLGQAATLVAENKTQEAVTGLTKLLNDNPGWLEGHQSLSAILGQTGDGQNYADSLKHALRRNANIPALHQSLVMANIRANDYDAATENLAQARQHLGDARWIDEQDAYCASEVNDIDRADKLFHALGDPVNPDQAYRVARHHIRAGRPEQSAEIGEKWIGRDPQGLLWPYLALAWRLLGDERWNWLEGDPRFISVYDLDLGPEELDRLASLLRKLHFADRQPLDQSLRSGTQTDGPLFSRIEPEITSLRAKVVDRVKSHIEQLPKADEGHPLLVQHRSPIRFAGSWSVRLTDQGFHVDHVHTQGWLSSALYISLPDSMAGSVPGEDPHAGWLGFGGNRDIVPDLEPFRLVEPKPGRLVLFPSTMWHGTRPFNDGERLTVAFDVARPAQV